jgi:Protein of unknown function (DUF3891)
MLLRADTENTIVIGQPAHAWLSGQLARAWGNDRFPAPEPWEEVCLAAEQHDLGMAEWERAPKLNPETGLPRSFMELELDDHLEIWWRAAPLVLQQSRYAALLVSMHGTALYERRKNKDDERIKAFLDGQHELQERLIAGFDEEQVRRNQRLVWTWDSLSLGLLLDWAPFELDEVGIKVEDGTLDPWPFAAPQLTVHCEGRRLTGRFTDEASMQRALGEAPWVTIETKLTKTTDAIASVTRA